LAGISIVPRKKKCPSGLVKGEIFRRGVKSHSEHDFVKDGGGVYRPTWLMGILRRNIGERCRAAMNVTDHELPGTLAGESTSPRLRRTIGLLCAAYALATLAILPVAHLPGPVVPAVTTTFGAGVLITDLCTSFLLLVQFRGSPSWSMLLLAAAYFYSGAMALLHILTFPGAWIADTVLLGNFQSVGWLVIFWVLGYPGLVLTSVIAEAFSKGRRIETNRVGYAVATVFIAVIASIVALALIATVEQSWLPHELEGNAFAAWGKAAQWTSVGLSMAAFLLLWLVTCGRNVLYGWLGLALVAFMAFDVLAVSGGGRYTVGWDLSRVSGFISASLLLVFFLGQFSKLHRSLEGALHRLRGANDNLERRVAERTAELETSNESLRKALDERGVLLREVYHRVKNNLQVVDSIIALQFSGRSKAPPDQILNDVRQRIYALGLVHQQLMTSDDLKTFDIRPFFDEIRRNLSALDGQRQGVTVTVDADALTVDLDFAIPLGLLVTELVSNALKHAFPEGRGGDIQVLLRHCPDDSLFLAVSDNGNAAPIPTVKPGWLGGLGLRIVEVLAAQLQGEVTMVEPDGAGTGGVSVEIRMPLPAVASR
jgi:two-component sensor histidine kinase